jgi:methylenetetrahydrofolate dehydrogenase (NADP+)/methenyltetrahydrofolate cyclohydrolase
MLPSGHLMPAQILDGRALARKTRDEVRRRVAALRARGVVPRLVAVVAAQDPASLAYVRMKRRWAEEAGMESGAYEVTGRSTTEEVLAEVARLNADPAVHGVLVQHPLPGQVDEDLVLRELDPGKDVDGITPYSIGALVTGRPGFRPATPLGIVALLDEYGIAIAGSRAVVIGRSVILGKPTAHMLLERDATVTIAHSKTGDLARTLRDADIVVAAAGRPELVRGEWLKPGCAVLDAGFNKVPGRETDVGDCHFASCSEVAAWISPVPGGVGPMTVASLLANTALAAESTQE